MKFRPEHCTNATYASSIQSHHRFSPEFFTSLRSGTILRCHKPGIVDSGKEEMGPYHDTGDNADPRPDPIKIFSVDLRWILLLQKLYEEI